MRRRLALLAAAASALALTFALAGVASANEGPHGGYSSTTDACAGCHRAHTAQTQNLLIDKSTDELCFSCHNGSGATTNVMYGVETASGANPGAALNGGGFLQVKGTAVTSAHNVQGLADYGTSGYTDSGTGGAWGGGDPSVSTGSVTGELECTSCHNPHGSKNFRMLNGMANYKGVAQSWTGFTYGDTTAPSSTVETAVFQTGAYVGALPDEVNSSITATNLVSTHNYAAGTDVGYDRGVSDFCSTCHTNYLQDFANTRTTYTDPYGVVHNATATGVRAEVPYDFNGDGTKETVFRHAVSYKSVWNYQTGTWDSTPNGSTSKQLNGIGTTAGHQVAGVLRTVNGDNPGTAGSGTVSPTNNNDGGNMTCLTCHYAHGSTVQAQGYAGQNTLAANANGNGDSNLLYIDNRGVCQACHNK